MHDGRFKGMSCLLFSYEKKSFLQKDGSKPVMIRVNQRSPSKANADKESRKPKAVENDSDSDESMFEYGSDESEILEWSDIDDSSDDDENMELVEGVVPPVDDVEQPSERIENELAEEGSKNFSKGMYLIVEYEGELFPGEITDVIEDGVIVSCMEKCDSIGSTLKWPKKMDETVYPFCHIYF